MKRGKRKNSRHSRGGGFFDPRPKRGENRPLNRQTGGRRGSLRRRERRPSPIFCVRKKSRKCKKKAIENRHAYHGYERGEKGGGRLICSVCRKKNTIPRKRHLPEGHLFDRKGGGKGPLVSRGKKDSPSPKEEKKKAEQGPKRNRPSYRLFLPKNHERGEIPSRAPENRKKKHPMLWGGGMTSGLALGRTLR